MKKCFGLFSQRSKNNKENKIREAMIKYYDTINQGKLSLPSFILAELAMHKVRAYDRIEQLYCKLVG